MARVSGATGPTGRPRAPWGARLMARSVAHPVDDRLHLADRLALRVPEAARALGISERQLRQLLPEIPHTRLGACVVLPVDGLRTWLREQASIGKSRVDSAVDDIVAAVRERVR